MSMGHVIVIDDEQPVRDFVCTVLEEDGWKVGRAASAEEAFSMLAEHDWRVAFCDVVMEGADGFTVLRHVKKELPDTKVVLMTGQGNATGALDAAALGAYDYLLKPFDVSELKALSATLRNEISHRAVRHDEPGNREANKIELIGNSPAFIKLMTQVGRVAATNLPVLLTGESGTGKELVAWTLHRRSDRAHNPFVPVNCGAIPAELIESEMFGHVRGSFTGADRDRRGLWEEAHGGTIFLDEISETSLSFQVKLLRVLQEREIRRVGSNQVQRVDVRILAACNSELDLAVKAGRFRRDLFYRLNAMEIVLPPLRDRADDIMPLARYFAGRIQTGKSVAFSAEAIELLQAYPWPGNIRELENAIVRASVMCEGIIRPSDLPEQVRDYEPEEILPLSEAFSVPAGKWPSLAELEAQYLKRVMQHTSGNKTAASRILNVDRTTVERMVKRNSAEG